MANVQATPRSPGRPRDDGVRAGLLRATQDLLVEDGFDRLTVDAVAKRCSASKATIYRRWPSKIALVVAAAADLIAAPEVPDTGDLRSDLLECARAYQREDSRSQLVLANVMTAARHDAELRHAARETMGAPYSGLFEQVLTRAVSRGDIAPDIDIELIGEVFSAIAFHRLTALGLVVDESIVLRVVDGVLLPALRVD